jgi:MOSC domain-containing protein YiiM
VISNRSSAPPSPPYARVMATDTEARVVSLASSPRHGFSKQVQPQLRLIAGEGVEGDAHRGVLVQHLYSRRRDPKQPNLAQVHLLDEETLARLAQLGFHVPPGALGENILTRGLSLLTLPRGTQLQLGREVVLEVTGLRTPCSKIDGLQPGLQQHLWGERAGRGKRERRAGIMAVVLTGGTVSAEDAVQVRLPPLPHTPLGPV